MKMENLLTYGTSYTLLYIAQKFKLLSMHCYAFLSDSDESFSTRLLHDVMTVIVQHLDQPDS